MNERIDVEVNSRVKEAGKVWGGMSIMFICLDAWNECKEKVT